MLDRMFHTPVAVALTLIAAAGCKTNGKAAEGDQTEQPDEAGADEGEVVDDEEDEGDAAELVMAKALWMEAKDYREWPAHTPEPVEGVAPHGEYIHLFYNDTAKAAMGGEGDWPDEAIFAKDNFPADESGEGPGELASITMMKKEDETWFWVKYEPDGTVMETPEGELIAGTEDLGCISCHAASGLRDHVITKLGE